MGNAVTQGFGSVQYGQPNWELSSQLRGNGSVFAAFKAHKQQNELHALLTDPATGKLKSFSQFKKDSEPIIGKYNRDWLKTEYNTAVKRARTAEQFARAQATKHLYPNLRWTPSRSVHTRKTHESFYNQVWPIDDPFWSSNYPGNLWNCKCGIERTDDPASAPAEYDAPPPAPGLDENPVNGELFTKTSPIMQGVSKREAASIETDANLLLIRDTRTKMRDWAKNNIPDTGLKLDVSVKEFDQLTVRRSDVRSITAKPHKFAADAYGLCDQLDKVLNQAEYMGWSPDATILLADGTTVQKHPSVGKWLYYKFKLNKKNSYLNVMFDKQRKEFRVYCIVDDAAFDKCIIAHPIKK